MTKENAKDFLPLIQALAEGKTVQAKLLTPSGDAYWEDFSDSENIQFGGPPEHYRVKPEPREWYVLIGKDNRCAITESKEYAERCRDDYWTELVHVREVV